MQYELDFDVFHDSMSYKLWILELALFINLSQPSHQPALIFDLCYESHVSCKLSRVNSSLLTSLRQTPALGDESSARNHMLFERFRNCALSYDVARYLAADRLDTLSHSVFSQISQITRFRVVRTSQIIRLAFFDFRYRRVRVTLNV
jgi:hypothetical protein